VGANGCRPFRLPVSQYPHPAPFLPPARRTGRADFPHPAPRPDSHVRPQRDATHRAPEVDQPPALIKLHVRVPLAVAERISRVALASPCRVPSSLPRRNSGPIDRWGAPERGLPLLCGGSASATSVFGTCSTFTRVTARWLAELPWAALGHPRLSSVRCLPSDFDCLRSQPSPTGMGLAPTGSPTPVTAHARSASKCGEPTALACAACSQRRPLQRLRGAPRREFFRARALDFDCAQAYSISWAAPRGLTDPAASADAAVPWWRRPLQHLTPRQRQATENGKRAA
jgi:hypothetical protein